QVVKWCLTLLLLLVPGCDTVQDRDTPTWSYIHAAIVQPSCATSSCHSRISSVAGRDFSTTWSAYAYFTDRVCGAPTTGREQDLDKARNKILNVLHGVGGDNTL